jgi:hypothetical protein
MKILVEKFAFDTTGRPPVYVNQVFAKVGDGLEHYIDGVLRAQVPELGVADYVDSVNVKQALTQDEQLTIIEAFSDL